MASDEHEERWTACTPQGDLIRSGNGISKRAAASGMLHASVDIWMWRRISSECEVLLVRRSPLVKTWSGMYDMSAGGHVVFGDSVLDTVYKEAEEELGLRLRKDDLAFMCKQPTYQVDERSGIIEYDLSWVYGVRLTESAAQTISFPDGEADKTVWLSMVELERLMRGEMPQMAMVPHDRAYNTNVIEQLKRLQA